jgi:hypothetical protein
VSVSQSSADGKEEPRRSAPGKFVKGSRRIREELDVLSCPSCGGRMKLLALVTAPKSIARYLRALGEPTDVPRRSPSRGPPF